MNLMDCPTCGRETAAVAFTGAGTFCPACAPTPELRPHDYRPVTGCDPRLAVKANAQAPDRIFVIDEVHSFTEAQWLAAKNLVSGVCCGDSGDCAHECGIA